MGIGQDILPILVHEIVEKYMTEKYGLNIDKESDKIATEVKKILNQNLGEQMNKE